MGTKTLFHLVGSICLTSYEQMLHIFLNAFYQWPEKSIFQQTKHQHPEVETNHFQNCSPLNWNSLYKNRCNVLRQKYGPLNKRRLFFFNLEKELERKGDRSEKETGKKSESTFKRKGAKAFAVQLGSKMALWLSAILCLLEKRLGLVCLILDLCETVPIRSPLLYSQKQRRKGERLCPFNNK